MSKNLAWLLVLIGGVCEVFWVSGLKYADTLGLQILTGVGISISFVCMLLAIKALEISVAYSVFVGIGAGGIVIMEILAFGEPASIAKLSLIALLMCAVIGLKFTTHEGGQENSKRENAEQENTKQESHMDKNPLNTHKGVK